MSIVSLCLLLVVVIVFSSYWFNKEHKKMKDEEEFGKISTKEDVVSDIAFVISFGLFCVSIAIWVAFIAILGLLLPEAKGDWKLLLDDATNDGVKIWRQRW